MKVEVKRACGHKETIDMFGPAAERKRKIMWYERTDCAECYRKSAFDEVEMSYSKYKNEFSQCKTKAGSYNSAAKTIVAYVPKPKPDEVVIRVPVPVSDKNPLEGLIAEFALSKESGVINYIVKDEVVCSAPCIENGEQVAMLKVISHERLAKMAEEFLLRLIGEGGGVSSAN